MPDDSKELNFKIPWAFLSLLLCIAGCTVPAPKPVTTPQKPKPHATIITNAPMPQVALERSQAQAKILNPLIQLHTNDWAGWAAGNIYVTNGTGGKWWVGCITLTNALATNDFYMAAGECEVVQLIRNPDESISITGFYAPLNTGDDTVWTNTPQMAFGIASTLNPRPESMSWLAYTPWPTNVLGKLTIPTNAADSWNYVTFNQPYAGFYKKHFYRFAITQ